MTQELYEKCTKWEQQFRWAIKSAFVHMSTGEFNEVAALYREVFNEGLTTSQINCNTCRLKALIRLGNDYFAFQQELAEKAKEERLKEIMENNPNAVVQPQPTKRTAGRKKKIDV